MGLRGHGHQRQGGQESLQQQKGQKEGGKEVGKEVGQARSVSQSVFCLESSYRTVNVTILVLSFCWIPIPPVLSRTRTGTSPQYQNIGCWYYTGRRMFLYSISYTVDKDTPIFLCTYVCNVDGIRSPVEPNVKKISCLSVCVTVFHANERENVSKKVSTSSFYTWFVFAKMHSFFHFPSFRWSSQLDLTYLRSKE